MNAAPRHRQTGDALLPSLLYKLLDHFKVGDLVFADRGFRAYVLFGLLLQNLPTRHFALPETLCLLPNVLIVLR